MTIRDVRSLQLGVQQPAVAARVGLAQAIRSRIKTDNATAIIERLAIFRNTPAALLGGLLLERSH